MSSAVVFSPKWCTIHDAQYSTAQYADRVGWGHSTLLHGLDFARMAGVKRFLTFHHDPGHDDATLDRILAQARARAYTFEIIPGIEGARLEL